jgi:CPA1 family monovalent cation:H+ antiporter
VGCCEKSARRHAERHFWNTGHPMIDALGPERVWSFCFVDQIRIFVSRP